MVAVHWYHGGGDLVSTEFEQSLKRVHWLICLIEEF
jgi:hypothetical protein